MALKITPPIILHKPLVENEIKYALL